MARILAIDYGAKRTGLAATDPLQIIASPLHAVLTSELFDFLASYLSTEEVETIVVGYPTRDDGSPTSNTPGVVQFVKELRNKYPKMDIALQDEWNTSKDAVMSMVKGGTRKKYRRNKMNVDKISATLIRQYYLQNK
jgi:putative Holliday junction resolvase